MRTLFREYRMIRVELATVFKQQSVRANYVCMHMIHKLLMPIKFIRCIVLGPIERCIMNRAAMGNILELWIMELSRRKKNAMNPSDCRHFSTLISTQLKMSLHDVLDLMNTEHKNTVCHLLGFCFLCLPLLACCCFMHLFVVVRFI